jgi:hypothetical protein
MSGFATNVSLRIRGLSTKQNSIPYENITVLNSNYDSPQILLPNHIEVLTEELIQTHDLKDT